MATKVPVVPKGTGAGGARLWRDILGAYELQEHEMALLREAVRTVDQLDQLHAMVNREGLIIGGPHGSKPHPALTEARQQRIALARVLAALRPPARPPATRMTPPRVVDRNAVSVRGASTGWPDAASRTTHGRAALQWPPLCDGGRIPTGRRCVA